LEIFKILAASARVNNLIAVSVFFIVMALLNPHPSSKAHAMVLGLGNGLFLKGKNKRSETGFCFSQRKNGHLRRDTDKIERPCHTSKV
jgi:hypothetical protein